MPKKKPKTVTNEAFGVESAHIKTTKLDTKPNDGLAELIGFAKKLPVERLKKPTEESFDKIGRHCQVSFKNLFQIQTRL
jgi:hypothetical protein